MRTTTTVWPTKPPSNDEEKVAFEARRAILCAEAVRIAGDEVYRDLFSIEVNEDHTLLSVKRPWPGEEEAQAWVDLMINEYNAISAVIDPVDTV